MVRSSKGPSPMHKLTNAFSLTVILYLAFDLISMPIPVNPLFRVAGYYPSQGSPSPVPFEVDIRTFQVP